MTHVLHSDATFTLLALTAITAFDLITKTDAFWAAVCVSDLDFIINPYHNSFLENMLGSQLKVFS